MAKFEGIRGLHYGSVSDRLDYLRSQYEQCKADHGEDASITRGYAEQISRIERGVSGKSLEELVTSGHGRPVS